MFITIRKKVLILALCALAFAIGLTTYFSVRQTDRANALPTIVIDAGHGGIDGGSVGLKGTVESKLNLSYALKLKEYCQQFGFKVVLTRTGEGGLYSPFAKNKKRDDMKKRKEIIEKSNCDLIVSVHMNSFSDKSARGAQVFYNQENEISKSLASSIQTQFAASLVKAKKTALVGDYYMLNCTEKPAVIVECGFLSNAEEEALLITESYKEKTCYAVVCGIVTYLSIK